jgi:hypothetical protein
LQSFQLTQKEFPVKSERDLKEVANCLLNFYQTGHVLDFNLQKSTNKKNRYKAHADILQAFSKSFFSRSTHESKTLSLDALRAYFLPPFLIDECGDHKCRDRDAKSNMQLPLTTSFLPEIEFKERPPCLSLKCKMSDLLKNDDDHLAGLGTAVDDAISKFVTTNKLCQSTCKNHHIGKVLFVPALFFVDATVSGCNLADLTDLLCGHRSVQFRVREATYYLGGVIGDNAGLLPGGRSGRLLLYPSSGDRLEAPPVPDDESSDDESEILPQKKTRKDPFSTRQKENTRVLFAFVRVLP